MGHDLVGMAGAHPDTGNVRGLVWTVQLAQQMPSMTPVVGVGVPITTLASVDVSMILALRRSVSAADHAAGRELGRPLGLGEISLRDRAR